MPFPFPRRSPFIGTVAALALASCDAIPALTFATGDGATDGGARDGNLPDGSPPADGGTSDAPTNDGGLLPVVIAQVGAVPAATGGAQQTHLIYATNTGRWWLFWIDSATPMVLNTSSSPDFRTWSAGPTLALPLSHNDEGRNFSVDYASIASLDVVHLTIGLLNPSNGKDRRRYHVRAALGAGGTVTFGAVNQITSVNDMQLTDPDGAVTCIGTDQKVSDVSGWVAFGMGGGTGDESAWTSTNVDTGTSGGDMFGAQADIAKTPLTVHSRALVALSGGQLLAFWDTADQAANPTNVDFSTWNGTMWSTAAQVFVAAEATNIDDWTTARLTDTDVHAVRRTVTGTYEHLRYASSWAAGGAIPMEAAKMGGGLLLLTDGTHLELVTLAGDANTSVRAISWNGSSWGSWSTLAGTPSNRTYLSGYAAGSAAAVVWTEPSGIGFQISGIPITLQ